MLKNATYKEKFIMLQEWMPLIIDTVKKDLKNEHLRNDLGFVRTYFPGKTVAKITTEELAPAYTRAIASAENTEELAEFIANRWLLKNSELYHYFEEELKKINPNFSELDSIDMSTAQRLMDEASRQFGPVSTYLFCVFNSVVFPEEIYRVLGQHAKVHAAKAHADDLQRQEAASLDALKAHYEMQIARLTDKYEKKIMGLQKKYVQDMETCKKQISSLQKKIAGQ